jgi:hypothetical protein
MYVCMYVVVCIYVCKCVCMYVPTYALKYYMCVYVCMNECVCVCLSRSYVGVHNPRLRVCEKDVHNKYLNLRGRKNKTVKNGAL